MTVLAQMATSVRSFSAKRVRNAVDIAKGRAGRFQVELRRLRQERFLTVVVQGEQGTSTFDLGLHHERWSDFRVMTVEKVVTEALEHKVAHFQHG